MKGWLHGSFSSDLWGFAELIRNVKTIFTAGRNHAKIFYIRRALDVGNEYLRYECGKRMFITLQNAIGNHGRIYGLDLYNSACFVTINFEKKILVLDLKK